jgi:hypothetical protein
MQRIFDEYGGVIIVVSVIAALIIIITAFVAGGQSSVVGQMFDKLFTNMQGVMEKVSNVTDVTSKTNP